MRKRILFLLPVGIIGAGLLILTHFTFKTIQNDSVERQTLSLQNFGHLSIVFEPNWGQAEKSVNFLHSGKNYSVLLKSTESVFLFNTPTKAKDPQPTLNSKSF